MTHDIVFLDKDLYPIWEKVRNGDRLGLEDGLTLYRSHDLLGVGAMAHEVQRRRSGDIVYYVLNQKIEPTNVCVLSCKFCNFAVKKGAPPAYEMTLHDILRKLTPEIDEVHITGGLHPEWQWEYYLDMVRQIKLRYPKADVKAFTAVEIDFFHKKFKMPVEEIFRQLKEAGLRTMPGGGAEVFSERVRRLLFNQKIGAKRWLEIHTIAHRMGIPTNATMLYGHIETLEERLRHMMLLRETQDATGGFFSFIPLAFQPGDTGIKPRGMFTSAIDDLKTIAISRLMLDNFPHIKAYWVMLTEEVASVALNFGADDMDGTVGGENIAHDAGAISPMKLAKDQLIKIIKDAGKIPVERDVYYQPLNISSERVIGKIPFLNSVPFYERFERRGYKIMPIVPRRMGLLAEKGQMDAGLFSCADFLRMQDRLRMLNYGIASRDQVRSVMLFSRYGWRDLEGRRIGITDETATSIKLLKVLLEKKYGVKTEFVRMHAGVNNYAEYDAVLLIGDNALQMVKSGLAGFDLVYDLATEWYHWQKLPFVFAVWAVSRVLPDHDQHHIEKAIADALELGEADLEGVGHLHARQIGLSDAESREYLEGFNYRLGERERTAIEVFARLLQEVEVTV